MSYTLLILFTFSSICSLIFEVVWAKMLMPVFGNTVYVTTIVITTFMTGLAIGGLCGGRYVEKNKSPLLIFFASQFLIGVYAFFVPQLIHGVKTLYLYFTVEHEHSLNYLITIRGLLSFLIILLPTSLMGAAIPVLAKEISDRSHNCIWSIGSVYSVSAFGGAIGCFLAGFILIITFGIAGSNYLAAAISIAISVVAFIIWLCDNIQKSLPPAHDPSAENVLQAADY